MSDTQESLPIEGTLQTRIDSLISLHQQYQQRRAQLVQELSNVDGSLLKLEGAIEALADFKRTTFEQDAPKSAAGDSQSEEVVDAEYTETESVN